MFELETKYVDKFVGSERLSSFGKEVKKINRSLHDDCDDKNDYRIYNTHHICGTQTFSDTLYLACTDMLTGIGCHR